MKRSTVLAVLLASAVAVFALASGAAPLDLGQVASLFEPGAITLAVVGAVALGADKIEEIEQRMAEIVAQCDAIQAKADGANRGLTDEETKAVTELYDEFERLDVDLDRRKKQQNMANKTNAGTGRKSDPGQPGSGQPKGSGDGLLNTRLQTQSEKDRWGFNNVGEFAQAVMRGVKNPQNLDQRIIKNAALTTYSSDGVGPDGGFLVPPAFADRVQRLVAGEDSMLARVDAQPTNSPLVIVPTDEDPAWGASGGVRVYRRAEANAMTQSKLALKEITTRVDEIYALVPVTETLAEDAPMLASFLTDKAGEKLNFKITDEIVNGIGSAGQMLGIMNSPALITVSKESSQGAGTIVGLNLLKMFSRMFGAVRGNGAWLINQDIEPQLYTVNTVFKNAAGSAEIAAGLASLLQEGSLRYDPTKGTLFGLPIITTEACQTVGTKGDIILAYLKGYFCPYRSSGVRSQISQHLWFDQGMMAFRWTFRVGGQPWLSAPITRRNGSNTLSHFVALENR